MPSNATDDALEIARASYAIRAVSQVVVSHGRRGDRTEVGIVHGRSERQCFTAYSLFLHGRDSCHVDVEEKRAREIEMEDRKRERAERKWRNVPQSLGLCTSW